MQPILAKWWESGVAEKEFGKRYLIPSDKHPQRKTDPAEIRKWINKRLRGKLEGSRMYDGTGQVIDMRSPYQRCLTTPRLSLVHGGLEEDERRYFFGLHANSTAGEYYCDFVNFAEQARMRAVLDQWLGSPNQTNLLSGEHIRKNPPAELEMAFGEQGQVAHVVFELEFPPVEEVQIPKDGYRLQICAQRGLSLGAWGCG